MRINNIHLTNFKRFDDLTIDLGTDPKKIIALVGPNGCGKSSIFDAFEEQQKQYKNANRNADVSFFSKLWFAIDSAIRTQAYNRGSAVQITKSDGTNIFDKKSFYIRTAYRFTPELKVGSINAQPDIIDDVNRPTASHSLDNRLRENYERMLGIAFTEFFNEGDTAKTGSEVRQELIGRINDILSNILDIKITNIGDVISGKGQLFFEKGTSKDFPFENLSSGEKEVIDIILDLIVKLPSYNDTVYCIDEPELHLNTAIQRNLLIEIEKLIPDTCQLWIATHSIGFLRALQDELSEESQIIDFTDNNYFDGIQTISPIKPTRKNWQKIFKTALEDLTGLIAPQRVVYCEGVPLPGVNGDEVGLDAQIYNEIFEDEFNNTLFVSSGGTDVIPNASLALKIIAKALSGTELYLLKDRDNKSGDERNAFLAESGTNRMLERREIENYIFDSEILTQYMTSKSLIFDETVYRTYVTDINNQDLKLGSTIANIKTLCGFTESIVKFKLELSKNFKPEMSVYQELKGVVFPIK